MSEFVEIKNKKIGLGRPKVCVPLVCKTKQEIITAIDKIVKMSEKTYIDMVEFRGDFYEALYDLKELKELIGYMSARLGDIILLFTIRSEAEGGERLDFSEPCIKEINKFVIENCMVDMVDVEYFSGEDAMELITLAKEHGVKTILSNHDFKTTPDEEIMVCRLDKMQRTGADIVKIAVMPEDKWQVLSLIKALMVMKDEYAKVPIVAISMGALGTISRLIGELTGSAITFASLENASAPGQIPVQDMGRILDDIGKFCV